MPMSSCKSQYGRLVESLPLYKSELQAHKSFDQLMQMACSNGDKRWIVAISCPLHPIERYTLLSMLVCQSNAAASSILKSVLE